MAAPKWADNVTPIADRGNQLGGIWYWVKQGANAIASFVSSSTSSATGGIAVVGFITNPSASFVRPGDGTQYSIGDLVANNTAAGSVVAMQLDVGRLALSSVMIRRIKVHKLGTSTTNAQFRVHFFRTSPTSAAGDNAAFSTNNVADYIGAFDVTIDRAFTNGSAGFGVPTAGNDMSVKLSDSTFIYALIEARAAYTPQASESFTVTLDDLQN